MERPRIALVHDWLVSSGGAEQVLLALHNLFPDAPIYTSLYRPSAVPQFGRAKVISSYLQPLLKVSPGHEVLIPLVPQAFESFNLKEYDLVFSEGCGYSKGVLTQPNQPHLSYSHSPARYLWNMGNDIRNRGRFDSGLRSWAEHRLRIWDVVSADRVDTFFANSALSASRVEKVYRKPAKVIYPPVPIEEFTVGTEQRDNFFLAVGRLVQYKRVDLIIQACKKIKAPLKIVGAGAEESALKKLAEDAPWIEFLGFVSDAERASLFQTAKATVFAAEEDFGIVPVEAMAAGCPVIAFGKGGATESVVAGVTGQFFMEQTVPVLAEVLESFSAGFDSRAIRQQAEKFSVEAFNSRILQEVEAAL